LVGLFTIVITTVVPSMQAQETNDAKALTSGSGVEDYPSWSPDGLELAYAASEAGDVFGGNWDIWTVAIGGEAPKNLTSDFEGDDRFPSWSPDGKQIGFWSEREGGGYFIIPSSGGTPQRLETSASVPSSPPRWSADGHKLACMVRDDAGVFVEIVTLPSGPIQRLPLPGKNTRRFDLSWSADERYLAYVDASSLTSHVSQVMVLNLVDETTVAVTDGWTSDWSPFWAPGGRGVLFVSNRSGKKDLWLQGFEDGRPAGRAQRVTRDIGVRHAAISSDGARLAYSQGRRGRFAISKIVG
jgi:Tol biopolymer transport system component